MLIQRLLISIMGMTKKVPLETLNGLYKLTVGDFKPDLTILFDLDPKVGLERSYKNH